MNSILKNWKILPAPLEKKPTFKSIFLTKNLKTCYIQQQYFLKQKVFTYLYVVITISGQINAK